MGLFKPEEVLDAGHDGENGLPARAGLPNHLIVEQWNLLPSDQQAHFFQVSTMVDEEHTCARFPFSCLLSPLFFFTFSYPPPRFLSCELTFACVFSTGQRGLSFVALSVLHSSTQTHTRVCRGWTIVSQLARFDQLRYEHDRSQCENAQQTALRRAVGAFLATPAASVVAQTGNKGGVKPSLIRSIAKLVRHHRLSLLHTISKRDSERQDQSH